MSASVKLNRSGELGRMRVRQESTERESDKRGVKNSKGRLRSKTAMMSLHSIDGLIRRSGRGVGIWGLPSIARLMFGNQAVEHSLRIACEVGQSRLPERFEQADRIEDVRRITSKHRRSDMLVVSGVGAKIEKAATESGSQRDHQK